MSGYVWSCLLTKLCDEYAVTNGGILLTKRRWHFRWSTMNTYSPQLNGDLQFSVFPIHWLAFQQFLPLFLCSSSNLWFGTTLKMTSTIDIIAGENPFLRPSLEKKKNLSIPRSSLLAWTGPVGLTVSHPSRKWHHYQLTKHHGQGARFNIHHSDVSSISGWLTRTCTTTHRKKEQLEQAITYYAQ